MGMKRKARKLVIFIKRKNDSMKNRFEEFSCYLQKLRLDRKSPSTDDLVQEPLNLTDIFEEDLKLGSLYIAMLVPTGALVGTFLCPGVGTAVGLSVGIIIFTAALQNKNS